MPNGVLRQEAGCQALFGKVSEAGRAKKGLIVGDKLRIGLLEEVKPETRKEERKNYEETTSSIAGSDT
jgi:hypothetical protein